MAKRLARISGWIPRVSSISKKVLLISYIKVYKQILPTEESLEKFWKKKSEPDLSGTVTVFFFSNLWCLAFDHISVKKITAIEIVYWGIAIGLSVISLSEV